MDQNFEGKQVLTEPVPEVRCDVAADAGERELTSGIDFPTSMSNVKWGNFKQHNWH